MVILVMMVASFVSDGDCWCMSLAMVVIVTSGNDNDGGDVDW